MNGDYDDPKDLPPEVLDEYREAFSLFDEDGDKFITTRELANVFRSLGQNPNDDHIAEMIKDADRDGDGTVDFEEFLGMMLKSLRNSDTEESLRESFNIFASYTDSGEYGLSPSNLQKVMAAMGEKLTDEEAEQMVRLADKDLDGFVSFQEFVDYMKTN